MQIRFQDLVQMKRSLCTILFIGPQSPLDDGKMAFRGRIPINSNARRGIVLLC